MYIYFFFELILAYGKLWSRGQKKKRHIDKIAMQMSMRTIFLVFFWEQLFCIIAPTKKIT